MRLIVEDAPKKAMDCPFAGISATPLTPKELFGKEIPVPKFYWKCSLFGGRCKLDLPEYFTECPHLIDIKTYLKGGQLNEHENLGTPYGPRES